MPQNAVRYVAWQNRATAFYCSARILYRQGIYPPAAFCAYHALETLLKATLIYHDKSFDPESVKHRFAKMLRSLSNKVPGSNLEVPSYFYDEQHFLALARYPKAGRSGFVIPGSFLNDLDRVFRELVELVPFQHNTMLKQHLASRSRRVRTQVTGGNSQARALRRFLRVRVLAG